VAAFKSFAAPYSCAPPDEANENAPGAPEPAVPRRRRKPQHRRLADVERRFRLFVQEVEDYAILMLDPEGRVSTWNEGAERLTGYRAREIIGRHISRFYTADDVKRGLAARLLEAAEAQGHAESEGWRVRKDGSLFWAKVAITAIRERGRALEGFGKVTRDLTERKRAEEALRQLSGRLVTQQDRTRTHLSRSLNDSTSPSLATLLSKLQLAKSRAEGETRDLIEDCVALGEYVSREIRGFSRLLHPPSLESDGLLATLQSYLRGFVGRHGIPVDMDFPANLRSLPAPLASTLYRVAQEFLENTLRSPGNSRVVARLLVQDGYLRLEIGSQGRSLSRHALQEARAGLGELGIALVGMRERMRRYGGSVDIDSRDSGTWVTAVAPVFELRS